MLDKNFNTPLHLAVANYSSDEVIENILDYGASINKRNIQGVRPRDYAKFNPKVATLLNNYAKQTDRKL